MAFCSIPYTVFAAGQGSVIAYCLGFRAHTTPGIQLLHVLEISSSVLSPVKWGDHGEVTPYKGLRGTLENTAMVLGVMCMQAVVASGPQIPHS